MLSMSKYKTMHVVVQKHALWQTEDQTHNPKSMSYSCLFFFCHISLTYCENKA